MADELEFPEGLLVKAPRPSAPDFVKASISIKREELVAWLTARKDEWINLDVKVSRGGKWYAAVNNYKPKGEPKSSKEKYDDGELEDDIPFASCSLDGDAIYRKLRVDRE